MKADLKKKEEKEKLMVNKIKFQLVQLKYQNFIKLSKKIP